MASKKKEQEIFEDAKALDTLQIKRLTLIGKRDNIFSRMQALYNHALNALTNDTEKDLFLCSIISLERLRSEFNEIVDNLNVTELTINPAYVVNYQSISAFDDMYCRCKFVYDTIKPSVKNVETANFNVLPHHKSIRLPELDLMGFCGDPIKWPIFYESFKRAIHENPDLTDHDRVQYLINKLSGRALSVCSGIVPNGDNYRAIWQTLIDKYDDKRALAAAYLDQMFEFKSFNNATSKNLDIFLDKFCTAVSSLKSLKLDDLSDFILLQLALKKIDSNTARSFEIFKRGASMPLYNDLIKFIREQSKILERTTPVSNSRSNDNYKSSITTKSTHSFATSYVTSCPLCKQIDHCNLYRCPAYSKLSIDEKFDFIKQNKGCTNCLSVSHSNNACNSKFNCRFCGCKHHSLLCRKVPFPREGHRAPPSAASSASALLPLDNTVTPAQRTNVCLSMQQNVSYHNIQPVSMSIANNNNTCLLGTVQVYATDSNVERYKIIVSKGKEPSQFLYVVRPVLKIAE
ncbi:unnamed protein product [Diatraea saccharalis]|uniref:Uncharacterized protein n=1 Tax=Diatraea saccharalis TaxID=40085 RepID=A0A9N9WE52_9NEOP|nr:unnamed protein product [Diatraea saccharalis]